MVTSLYSYQSSLLNWPHTSLTRLTNLSRTFLCPQVRTITVNYTLFWLLSPGLYDSLDCDFQPPNPPLEPMSSLLNNKQQWSNNFPVFVSEFYFLEIWLLLRCRNFTQFLPPPVIIKSRSELLGSHVSCQSQQISSGKGRKGSISFTLERAWP